MSASSSSSAATTEVEVQKTYTVENMILGWRMTLNSDVVKFNPKLDARFLGTTTILQDFELFKDVWKVVSERAMPRVHLLKKPAPTSVEHDAILSVMQILTVDYPLRVISTEQQVFYKTKSVISKEGYPRTLRGFIDLLMYNMITHQLCIVDLKTTKNTDITLVQATLKAKHEMQLRLYSFMLKDMYNLPYPPQIYLVSSCPSTGEVVLFQFPINLKDLESLENAATLYPKLYGKILSAPW